MAAAALAMGVQGCSDWDDHYSPTDGAGGSGASLWETISSNEELSKFATILRKAGYDKVLATDQTYTVWAPINSVLTDRIMDSLQNEVTDSALVAEFVNNHMARGSYRASGNINNESVHLLNGKVKTFNGAAQTYTIDDVVLKDINVPVGNGVLHTMNGDLPFEANLYEYIFRDASKKGASTTKIAELFQRYYEKNIDADKSVAGPTQGGQLTYLDTVYVETNALWDETNVQMDSEDSTYTMIIPTDEAWEKAYDKIASYYKYPTSFEDATLKINDGGDLAFEGSRNMKTCNGDSLRNYYVNMALVNDLAFSHKAYGGNNPLATKQVGQVDSLISTNRAVFHNTLPVSGYKVNNASDLFTNGHWENLSNGNAYVTDSLNVHPWISWCPVVLQSAGSAGIGASSAQSTSMVYLSSSERNPDVTGSTHGISSYYYVRSMGTQATPTAYFKAPALLSTDYAVYMTALPANVALADTASSPDCVSIYVGENRHTANGRFNNGRVNANTPNWDYKMNNDEVIFDFGTKDSARIVTKYIGHISLDVCYQGIDDLRPYFELECGQPAGEYRGKTYDNNFRILCFLYVPMEVVNYYMEKGYYTEDDYKGEMPELFWDLVNQNHVNARPNK